MNIQWRRWWWWWCTGDAPRRGQKTVDSHSRLFGEPSRPITPGKNHMKSSIPFGGQNSEAVAAQKLLTTNGHYNGKSGSVSSASSSVSSSTENLKMNSGSRSGENHSLNLGLKNSSRWIRTRSKYRAVRMEIQSRSGIPFSTSPEHEVATPIILLKRFKQNFIHRNKLWIYALLHL